LLRILCLLLNDTHTIIFLVNHLNYRYFLTEVLYVVFTHTHSFTFAPKKTSNKLTVQVKQFSEYVSEMQGGFSTTLVFGAPSLEQPNYESVHGKFLFSAFI